MITALIVDDEERARSVLRQMLSLHCPKVHLIEAVSSVKAAIKSIATHNPNLIFLDVEMPGGNGFELLKKVKNPKFKVIFTTAHGHYAIQAIKISALDYLLKPIDAGELKAAVARYTKDTVPAEDYVKGYESLLVNLNSGHVKVSVPHSKGLSFVGLDEIICCNSDKNYTELIITNGKKMISTKTLKEYEDIFTPFGFVRVHNSHLINMKHVQEYVKGLGGYVVMTDGIQIEVSRRRKAEFSKKLGGAI
ncbi:MAG TPA: response regulator transcription factor [Flavobacteriales bacterium]|nr:response regulator transcription factor [Flavobacteriales bacterium]